MVINAYIAVDAELRERSIGPVGDISAIFGRAARSAVVLGLEREILPLAEVREELVQKPRAVVRPAVYEGVDDIREVPFSEHAAFDDISNDLVCHLRGREHMIERGGWGEISGENISER